MSVSFVWNLKKHDRPSFRNGTSSDIGTLDRIFPGREISSKDIEKLRAMHEARRDGESLWGEIADKLEAIRGDDYAREVIIEVDTEF
jgi:hypothetical protein